MLNLDVVNSFVMEFFSLVTDTKNGTHWHARCPLCGDSKKNIRKKRFHLDYNNGNPIWQCFNCGRSGSFLEIYSELKAISIDDAKNELYGFDSLRDRLTNREIDVIKCLFNCIVDSEEIAKKLEIKQKTVKVHFTNIYRKTNINSRVEIVLRIFEEFF